MSTDPEWLRVRAQEALREAREARERGDESARLRALEQAREAADPVQDDPTLFAAACWRLARARYDNGLHEHLLEAVAPLLDTHRRVRGTFGVRRVVGPFDAYEPALRAVGPLARAVADHHGYHDPTLRALWTALSEWAEREQDGYLRWWSVVERAWVDAVTGRIDEVRAVSHQVSALRPSAGLSQHRHTRASRPEQSVPWLQVDMARTRLRAEVWAGDRRGALDSVEEILDACAGVDLAPHHDPWVLDALRHAHLAYDLPRVPDAWRRGWDALPEMPELPEPHRLRVGARTAADHARAARELHRRRAGPEWVVEAWLQAAEATSDDPSPWLEQATQEARRAGVNHQRLPSLASG